MVVRTPAKSQRILFDVLVLSVVSFIAYFLPFAKYSYRGSEYIVDGLSFLTGKAVAGGSVWIAPSTWLWLQLSVVILMGVLSVMHTYFKRKTTGIVMALLAAVTLIMQMIYSSTLKTVLDGTKDMGREYGAVMSFVIALLILIRAVQILYKEEVITALDLMVLPGLAYFVINNYIPMVGIMIAFKKIDYSVGILASEWVGFQNFQNLFFTAGSFFASDAFIITRNTLLYNITFITVGVITGVATGIMLSEVLSSFWKKFFQTSILLPQLISMVVVAYIVFAFLGTDNGLIAKTFFGDEVVNFYGMKKIWPFILVFVNNWKLIGYNGIIFMSSVVGIDRSLYEAAKVDGASKWQQITKITLPMLQPTIIMVVLLQVGRIFYSDFGLFYQVTLNSGTLRSVTSTIDTYVYNSLLVSNNISVSSAASTYQAVIGFVVVVVANTLVKKIDKKSALF